MKEANGASEEARDETGDLEHGNDQEGRRREEVNELDASSAG
jgi:hypothetical protein